MRLKMEELKEMECGELYSVMNKRMTTALMFHSEASDYFNFMGLHGFKRIHEYQYFKESLGKRKLSRTYLDLHNKLISEKGHEKIELIPTDWYKHTRMDIDDGILPKYTRLAFKAYREWEEETMGLLQDICHVFLDRGMIADYDVMMCYLRDVRCELKKIYRLTEELNSVGYDVLYIVEKQKEIHDCYKEKMKHLKA